MRSAFTRPGFTNALVVIVGWINTSGGHAVTQALVATGVAGRRHHEAFHRFFSRGTWKPDRLGQLLFEQIVEHLVRRGATIDLVLDDTLVDKKGPKILVWVITSMRSSRPKRCGYSHSGTCGSC